MKYLLIVLGLIFLLRVPSFFEPNWYGDEGIYLAIGQAIDRGSVLYRDIWDNKTPILYLIYATGPVLWWIKLMAAISVLGTCVGIFKISRSLFATFLVGAFLSIPRFEGTIANAELFFILPIVWGAYLTKERKRYFLIGLLAGIAFLIKVPAIFDFFAFFIFIFITHRKSLLAVIPGVIAPILVVSLYFLVNNSFGDFITGAFLNNATYVSIGSGPLSALSNPLFIKAAVLGAGFLGIVIGFYRKFISQELLFLSLWFGFSLFGALLSNRPYLHYLLQIVPPTTLLIIYLLRNFKKYWVVIIVVIAVLFPVYQQFKRSFRLETVPYYKNFINYAFKKESRSEYVNFFDRNTLKTYEIAEFVKNNTSDKDMIFVWDDAANIYVLSERKPATKFIQAHHLTLVDPKSYDLVIRDLGANKPKFIIVDSDSRFKFPKLDTFIHDNYEITNYVNNLIIYRLDL